MIVLSCNTRKKDKGHDNIYYIYDSKKKFKLKASISTKNRKFYIYTVPSYIKYDTIFEIVSWYDFMLIHYDDFGKNHNTDTTYVKPKSFLSIIDYYGDNWLSDNKNLIDFWKGKDYLYFSYHKDSADVFLIKDIKGKDSVLIQRVHRSSHPAREGKIKIE